jgi:hypothetical protein
MASRLEEWARAERQALNEDVRWLKGGARVLSPSGDDITASRIESLEIRLEHVNLVLREIENADRT